MTSRLVPHRRHLQLVLVLVALAGIGIGCGPKPDLSQLDATGRSNYDRAQFLKVVNDVTTTAIAANASGKLSRDATAQVLTINQQVIDVVAANPTTFKAKVLTVITNTRQALPKALNDQIGSYIQRAIDALAEVQ